MRIVEVVWEDAHCSTGEVTVKQAAKISPVRTHTVAYLVAENDKGLVLGTDTYEKQPKVAKIVNFIPWEVVISYEELVG